MIRAGSKGLPVRAMIHEACTRQGGDAVPPDPQWAVRRSHSVQCGPWGKSTVSSRQEGLKPDISLAWWMPVESRSANVHPARRLPSLTAPKFLTRVTREGAGIDGHAWGSASARDHQVLR